MEEQVRVSKCCSAPLDFNGGGYDGEELVAVTTSCGKCGQACKEKWSRAGRPKKVELPF